MAYKKNCFLCFVKKNLRKDENLSSNRLKLVSQSTCKPSLHLNISSSNIVFNFSFYRYYRCTYNIIVESIVKTFFLFMCIAAMQPSCENYRHATTVWQQTHSNRHTTTTATTITTSNTREEMRWLQVFAADWPGKVL